MNSRLTGDEVMGPLSEAADPETLAVGVNPANQRTAASPDMALSLPAARNFQPADFASMRDALFAPRPAPPKATPQRHSRRRAAEGVLQPSRQENVRPRMENGSGLDTYSNEKRLDPFNKQAAVGKPAAAREDEKPGQSGMANWVTRTAPLQAPHASGPSGEPWGQTFLSQNHPFLHCFHVLDIVLSLIASS